jgi:uncharacterized protein RhaS with RHS repeats
LSDFGYRFYRADVGKWLNRDPIGENGGINLYGFVDNNPLEYVDLSGYGKIKLLRKIWKHIQKRHISKNTFPDKSKFKNGSPNSIKRDIDKTVNNPDKVTKQCNGNTLYEKKFDRTLGNEGEQINRVVVDEKGNVVTNFPSHDFKVPGSSLGVDAFGEGLVGETIDFVNPLSDIQEIVDLINGM